MTTEELKQKRAALAHIAPGEAGRRVGQLIIGYLDELIGYREQFATLSQELARLQGFVKGEQGDTITEMAENRIVRLAKERDQAANLAQQLKKELEAVRACFAEASHAAGPRAEHMDKLKEENAKLRDAAKDYLDAHEAFKFENEQSDPESFHRIAGDVCKAEAALMAALATSSNSK